MKEKESISTGRRFGYIKAFAVFFLLLMRAELFQPAAEEIFIEDTGYYVDLPVGWEVMDISENRITFIDFTGEAFLQIKTYPGDRYDGAEKMFESIGNDIDAAGEGEVFEYMGRSTFFSVIEFSAGGERYSGYGLFIEGQDRDLALLSFSAADLSQMLNDYVVSALDSFSLNEFGRRMPGPVSTYYVSSHSEKKRQAAQTVFENSPIEWQVDFHAVEASQMLIERESLILADYVPQSENGLEAWKRFYRMVYRDSHSRLEAPAAILARHLADSPNERRKAERLLNWLQGFHYRRTGGSDLISPLHAAAFQDGDCDSRALVYSILLDYLGIESAVMVSAEYRHAMSAVDVPGSGARIPYGGKTYLVAETTSNVDIGMIAADMADPAKWVVIPFTLY